MSILLIILLVLAGIIGLVLLMALFMRKAHHVRCEITINAPSQKVFDFLKLLENQEKFNKHAMAGGERKKEFKGTDGTVGYIYSWRGDKDTGVGEKEIMHLVEGKKIETEIRFVKPFRATASMIMETESLPGNQTKVSWSNAGTLKFPINIFIPKMEKHVAKDIDTSLSTLKNILEK
ncbi:MAG TPA: SRPBCC family protein [Flavobacteriales bacterium]|nr:SRPBCC family protein [Flavobacteriales bacterium]